ncbi:molybdopterin molybdotransferase MoeA [Sulfurimonas sp. SAG-AH-194-I05]|nr:molybdopterin molybdotransferase MoeA [Sulfurimonas sp. SAG-AH-194-I05]MDF1874175.1 molybdopterin molybdotransferase MoeA [Sulfurimonas sp. SAG-AH-194-I05]
MAVTVEEALNLIYKNTTKGSAKILPIESVLGFVLAQNITATHNLPPFDNSAMDGYGVKITNANETIQVTGTIFAGDNASDSVQVNTAIKIMTGARIPEGCECVVPIEDTTTNSEGTITLPKNLTLAKHIRRAGEDIKIGQILLEDGQRLYAHHITLLASQGVSHVKVYKKPKIALFASGSELKMHFETVASHQLYNTNTPTFCSRVQELGCDVAFIGTAIDTLEDIQVHIQSALDSDLIITSGGVSVGDADYTREAFASFSCVPFFEKINIKPGKPTTFGKIGNTYVLNLPGNPLAAALNLELFGQSIILALSGDSSKYINTIKAKMKEDYKIRAGRKTLIPGAFDGEYFTPCEKFAPGMVSPLAISNSYIIVDETCGFLAKKSDVKVISTRFSFTSNESKSLVSGD